MVTILIESVVSSIELTTQQPFIDKIIKFMKISLKRPLILEYFVALATFAAKALHGIVPNK